MSGLEIHPKSDFAFEVNSSMVEAKWIQEQAVGHGESLSFESAFLGSVMLKVVFLLTPACTCEEGTSEHPEESE